MYGEEHPDITYLKEEEIGVILSKGCAELYKIRPSNPVDYLAKWLLNYSSIEARAEAVNKIPH
jgi:hypothetical protein